MFMCNRWQCDALLCFESGKYIQSSLGCLDYVRGGVVWITYGSRPLRGISMV
jgi:hypothetical protein